MKAENLAELEKGRGVTKIFLTRREVVVNNFLGGLAWGFGSALGATVVIAIGVWLLGLLGAVPFLGTVITDIISNVQISD